jgi:hypothetical protein
MYIQKRSLFKVNILLLMLVLITMALLIPHTIVFAANPPGTGQPNQDCQSIGVTPGHAVNSSGSAFNPNGKAGTVYAGQQPQNSVNSHTASQYDVACFQVSHH